MLVKKRCLLEKVFTRKRCLLRKGVFTKKRCLFKRGNLNPETIRLRRKKLPEHFFFTTCPMGVEPILPHRK
jgi:hypothetical protein